MSYYERAKNGGIYLQHSGEKRLSKKDLTKLVYDLSRRVTELERKTVYQYETGACDTSYIGLDRAVADILKHLNLEYTEQETPVLQGAADETD